MEQEMPTVRINGTAYAIDLAGRQFRNRMDPEGRVDFDSAVGRDLCRRTGVATCLRCGMSVILGMGIASRNLRCMRCGLGIEILAGSK